MAGARESREHARPFDLPVRSKRTRVERFCTSAMGMERNIVVSRAQKFGKSLMKGICATILGAFVVACSGCGGGGGESNSSTAQASAAPAIKAVVIDAEGDSTMFGAQYISGTQIQSPNAPPTVNQAALRASLGQQITVENNGFPGGTIHANLYGGNKSTLAARLHDDQCQIVVGNFAINDAYTTDAGSYRTDLLQWIATVRSFGKTPVLEEPNPVAASGYEKLDSFVAVISDVGQQQGVLVIHQYGYIKSLPNWQSMLLDGVHPTDQLYAIKGNREAVQLQSLVKSMQ